MFKGNFLKANIPAANLQSPILPEQHNTFFLIKHPCRGREAGNTGGAIVLFVSKRAHFIFQKRPLSTIYLKVSLFRKTQQKIRLVSKSQILENPPN